MFFKTKLQTAEVIPYQCQSLLKLRKVKRTQEQTNEQNNLKTRGTWHLLIYSVSMPFPNYNLAKFWVSRPCKRYLKAYLLKVICEQWLIYINSESYWGYVDPRGILIRPFNTFEQNDCFKIPDHGNRVRGGGGSRSTGHGRYFQLWLGINREGVTE